MALLLLWQRMVQQILLAERFHLCLINLDQQAQEPSVVVPRAMAPLAEDLQAEDLRVEVLQVADLQEEALRVELPPIAVPRAVDPAII